MFSKLTEQELQALKEVAQELKVKPEWIYSLVNFESKWNPKAQSKVSSAKGLMQWTNIGAKSKGLEKYKFESSADLIERYPTRIAQIKYPLKDYFKQYMPFNSEFELYVVTLAPAYKRWSLLKPLPEKFVKVNPGIKTPLHYVNKIRKANNLALVSIPQIQQAEV